MTRCGRSSITCSRWRGEPIVTSILRSAAAAAAIGLAGCSANGVMLLRGVVRGGDAGRAEPVGGVTVQCRDGREGVPGYSRATTLDDGSYRIEHRYKGTW